MVNLDRVSRIAELSREAERLARQEAHQQHHERTLARLASLLWVCRDAAEHCFEEALLNYREGVVERRRQDRDDG